jgi:hypothetical protein
MPLWYAPYWLPMLPYHIAGPQHARVAGHLAQPAPRHAFLAASMLNNDTLASARLPALLPSSSWKQPKACPNPKITPPQTFRSRMQHLQHLLEVVGLLLVLLLLLLIGQLEQRQVLALAHRLQHRQADATWALAQAGKSHESMQCSCPHMHALPSLASASCAAPLPFTHT